MSVARIERIDDLNWVTVVQRKPERVEAHSLTSLNANMKQSELSTRPLLWGVWAPHNVLLTAVEVLLVLALRLHVTGLPGEEV